MGQTADQLARPIQYLLKDAGARTLLDAYGMPEDLPDADQLVAAGHDPLHAAYVEAQNLVAALAESLSQFKPLDEYVKLAGDAQEDYMPQGPPMSPLTVSYFTCWAMFDLTFGPDRETIGSCLLDLAELLGIGEHHAALIRGFHASRMGLYQHRGHDGPRIVLQELVTGHESTAHSTSGYAGHEGEIWFVRLCPPVPGLADNADYHITMTTPYLLHGVTPEAWTAYLKKNLDADAPVQQAMHTFLKHGPRPRHWPEFVFEGYSGHRHDVIYLTGLPDVRASRPHAR